MFLNIKVPGVGEDKSTKDLVVSVLILKGSLTTKKIYNEIKKNYGVSCTYQAVHKTLNNLLNEGIITKKNKNYSLSLQWLYKVRQFCDEAEETVTKTGSFDKGLKFCEKTGNQQRFIFYNMASAKEYISNLQKEIYLKSKDTPICMQLRHLVRAIFYSEDSWEIIKIIKKHKVQIYMAVRDNTFYDRWCKKIYEKQGIKVMLEVDVARNSEIQILGDYIVQLYYPKRYITALDNLYKQIKGPSYIDLHGFYSDIYEKKEDVKVVIIENKEIAEQLRKQTISLFGSRK